jgi:AIG2-like family
MTMKKVCRLPLLLFVLFWATQYSRALDTYQYFAIGSNLMPSTMMSLRNLSPLAATAAILPDYALAFNIPGPRRIEPSAAAVVRRPHARVHGVLYTLTEDEFGTLGQSEGVPFTYRWERCRVIPYRGNGQCAGETALAFALTVDDKNYGVPAFVLMASQGNSKDESIPPSKSYLQILQDGARYWQLDQSYQEQLAATPVDPWVPGISGFLLATAEHWNPKPTLPSGDPYEFS